METARLGVRATIIEVKKTTIYEIPQNAEKVGIQLFELGWPRRKVINRLQLRLDFFLDAGGVYKDWTGDIFPIHEDILEQTFKNDPGYKWLSDFPKKCKLYGLKQSPSELVQKRLQIIDVALKTPAIGLAI
jgi:hypothetical protein